MHRSVIEAVRQGDWTFEPPAAPPAQVKATTALPGSPEKVDVLAERLALGLPLFLAADRKSYDERNAD